MEKQMAAQPVFPGEDCCAGALMELNDNEFQQIADLVYRVFGIFLTEKKKALVRGRLNKLVKTGGYKTFAAYYDDVVKDKSGSKLLQLIDKISTNHTFFFREKEHFDLLDEIILEQFFSPEFLKPSEPLRVWCAGCASGEEAYTLNIVIREYIRRKALNYDLALLATDISLTALEAATSGVYPADRLTQMPEAYRKRYFKQQGAGLYSVNPDLKHTILFKRLNLMQNTFPFKRKFHIVFLRNVMIYFDGKTRKDIINRLADYIHPGGYLFLGHSETLGRRLGQFHYVKPAVYKRL